MKIKNKKLLNHLLRPDWTIRNFSDLIPLKLTDYIDNIERNYTKIIDEIFSPENLKDNNVFIDLITFEITRSLKSLLRSMIDKN